MPASSAAGAQRYGAAAAYDFCELPFSILTMIHPTGPRRASLTEAQVTYHQCR
jgi:hypothetical protein